MEWDEIQRGMMVVAHPDDIEFGSAGTAARWVKDGKEVTYVIVTDGSLGSSDAALTRPQISKMRKQEQRAAAGVAGVEKVEFLDFPDGMLQPTLELRKAVVACIRRHKPDVLVCQAPVRDITQSVFVQHPDHLAAGEATLAAVYPSARDRHAFPELLADGLEPHVVREVWISGTGAADYFVDITSTIDIKMSALGEHKSQIDPERIAKFLPERARNLGKEHGMEYAEAFRRIQIG